MAVVMAFNDAFLIAENEHMFSRVMNTFTETCKRFKFGRLHKC